MIVLLYNLVSDHSLLYLSYLPAPVVEEEPKILQKSLAYVWLMRKRKYKESEEKFRFIFDRLTDGILLVNVNNNKFLMANDTICQMLGTA
jgi:PAS domain-containing protein